MVVQVRNHQQLRGGRYGGSGKASGKELPEDVWGVGEEKCVQTVPAKT